MTKTKALILTLCLFNLSTLVFANERITTNISQRMDPSHYFKREQSVLKVGLVYYGRFWSDADLVRIKPLLIERFAQATKNLVKLNVVYTETLDYKNKIENNPTYTNGNITDPSRLQRLWYYDNIKGNVLKEAYQQFKQSPLGNKHFEKLDALLVVSGAQFEALGLASGRIAITEQPREIAWALPDGGRTEIVSDEHIVDELVHELGHVMFLGHTSTHCMKPDLTLEQRAACCEASPSKNDIMSYCRKRANVGPDFFHKFEACNLEMIENKIRPAILGGGRHNISGRSRCR